MSMLRNVVSGGLFVAAVAVGLTWNSNGSSSGRPKDRIVGVRTDDAEVNAAKDKGRATVDTFLKRFQNPSAGESDFGVKFDLTHQGGTGDGAELIWASELTYDSGKLSGRIAGEPSTPGYSLGQRVDIDKADIIDWAINVNGKYDGHFTTRALMKHMPPEEAAQIAKYLGG